MTKRKVSGYVGVSQSSKAHDPGMLRADHSREEVKPSTPIQNTYDPENPQIKRFFNRFPNYKPHTTRSVTSEDDSREYRR